MIGVVVEGSVGCDGVRDFVAGRIGHVGGYGLGGVGRSGYEG